MKNDNVTWQSNSETTFSWWSSYTKDQIFDKNVNNINENSNFTHGCMAASINVEER